MKKTLVYLVLMLVALTIILPIVMLVGGTIADAAELNENLAPIFSSDAEGFAKWHLIPQFISFWGYVELLLDTPQFFVMFWNSIKLVFIILFFQLMVSVSAAWGFAQFNFKGKNFLFTLYIILMLMPFQVTMVSNYLVLDKLKLMNTDWWIILPAAFSTFTVFIIYRFFTSVPKELVEAAMIDGAGPVRTFIWVGVPLGMPGIIAAMILNFLEYWNMIEQPMLFLKDESKWPLSLYLPSISMQNISIAFVSSMMMLFPAVLIFLCGQKYLEQGILSAALKE